MNLDLLKSLLWLQDSDDLAAQAYACAIHDTLRLIHGWPPANAWRKHAFVLASCDQQGIIAALLGKQHTVKKRLDTFEGECLLAMAPKPAMVATLAIMLLTPGDKPPKMLTASMRIARTLQEQGLSGTHDQIAAELVSRGLMPESAEQLEAAEKAIKACKELLVESGGKLLGQEITDDMVYALGLQSLHAASIAIEMNDCRTMMAAVLEGEDNG